MKRAVKPPEADPTIRASIALQNAATQTWGMLELETRVAELERKLGKHAEALSTNLTRVMHLTAEVGHPGANTLFGTYDPPTGLCAQLDDLRGDLRRQEHRQDALWQQLEEMAPWYVRLWRGVWR